MSNLPFEETRIRGAGRLSPQKPRRMRWIMHVSWTSVFAGVAVALGVQVLLSMLGTTVGFGAPLCKFSIEATFLALFFMGIFGLFSYYIIMFNGYK